MLECLESEGTVHMRVKWFCYFVVCGQVLGKLVLLIAAYLLEPDNLHIDTNAWFILKGE